MHQKEAQELMPPAESHIAGQPSVAARAFVVATWAVFGAAMLLLNGSSPRGVYYIINAIGLIGLGVSIVWFVVAPQWRFACLAASILLILVYLLRWYLQVDEIYKTSPALGVGTAIERLIQVWASVFESNRAKYGVLWALLAAYWDVFMVPAQVLAAALVFFPRRGGNERIAQAR
jgi:hypothetical protein